MCHRLDDVMKLCCELSANQQIQTTVKGSGKGAAAAGGLAFAGGLVGGPLGIAVGECCAPGMSQLSLFLIMDDRDDSILLQAVLSEACWAAG